MEKKIRILQLSPRFVYPPDDGGKIGIFNILSEFSKQNCEVTFFAFDDGNVTSEDIRAIEKICELILFKHSTLNTPQRILTSLVHQTPLYLNKHLNNKIKEYISKILKSRTFDIIHADHSSMLPLALWLKDKFNIPVGVRLHNIEWMIWKRYADAFPKGSPKRFYLARQAKLLRAAESKMYQQADFCFAITEYDMQRALSMAPTAKIVVASAGVNPEEWSITEGAAKNPNELIIATSYNWIHNVNAIRWFLEETFPLIRKEIPDAELTLIGKNPPGWLENFKNKNVNIVGYVPKVQPYLNRASVYIAPLFVGGGIRIKILEAMAMNLPVVATTVSSEGIKAGAGNGLLIADDKEKFAEICIELLNNPEKTIALGLKARNFVVQEYSWEKNVKIMIDSYKTILKI